MIRRLAAFAAAVALVAAAVVIRDQVSGDDDGDGGDAVPAVLVCARELPPVCNEERPVGDIFDDVVERTKPLDFTWVAPGPWPQMADEARAFAQLPKLFGKAAAVASSPLVLALRNPTAPCEPLTWRCLGDAMIAGQARISGPGIASPYRLLVRAAFLTGYLGRSDYSTNDVVDDPAVSEWIAGVEKALDRARDFGATTVNEFLVKPGSADGFITVAASALDTRTERVAPAVRVDAVASGGAQAAGRLREALVARRWDPARGEADDDGLPSPGVLVALRELGS